MLQHCNALQFSNDYTHFQNIASFFQSFTYKCKKFKFKLSFIVIPLHVGKGGN